jgi:two-component system cell cycle sensor histidine kinase/response regulator CckA
MPIRADMAFEPGSCDHLLARAIDFTVVLDASGRVLAVSEAVTQSFGYEAGEWLGRSVLSLVHPEDAAAASESLLESTRACGRQVPLGVRLVDASGTWRPVEVVSNSTGEHHGVVVLSVRDHTGAPDELRRLETRIELHRQVVEMAAEQADQQALLDAIPDLVIRYDHEGRYLDCAGSSGDLPVPAAEFIGRSVREVLPAETAGRVMHAIGEALRTGRLQELEYQMEAGATVRDFEARFSPSGTDTVVSICRDITARRDAERARRAWTQEVQRREEAEKRAELESKIHKAGRLDALGRLTGGVAHDFNNLLGVIANYASVIRSSTTDESVIRDIGEIQEAVRKGSDLTTRLLQVGRNVSAEPREEVVGDVVAGICGVLERTGGDTSVGLKVDVRAPHAMARFDRSRLEQAVMNLVINARDASPASAEVLVTVESEPGHPPSDTGEVRVSVCDSGPGIPEELRDQVMEPFFTTKSPGKGTGLGLAVVHQVASEVGGRVEIDDAPGGGARVSILLPGSGVARAARRCGRVLVVDDDRDSLRSTARLLEAHGFEVTTAQGFSEALAELESACGVQAILTDVVMPGGSGVELDRKVRDVRPGVPVVFMTGHAALTEDAIPEGRAVLAKPPEVDELLACLGALVGLTD